MSFNFYLLFYNIFNKDSMRKNDHSPQQKKKKHIILPNELIIMIYKYADNNTKFHLTKLFYWLNNIYLQCDNIHCQNKAKYIIHFKVLSKKCNCIINKQELFFTNIVCSLNCNNCILLNYHYMNQSNYLQKHQFSSEFSSNYPLKFHTYTRFNKTLFEDPVVYRPDPVVLSCTDPNRGRDRPEPVVYRPELTRELSQELSRDTGTYYKYNWMNSCYNKKCIICLHNFYNEKINMYGIRLLN
jgi:hypothetical protein